MNNSTFFSKNTFTGKTVGAGLLLNVIAALATITICVYGLIWGLWRKLISLTRFSKYLEDDDFLISLQGTIAAFFPYAVPPVFLSLYLFAYRVELLFNAFQVNRNLRKQVIKNIQRLRKSKIGLANFVGRVGAAGFLGGSPRMPGGNPQGVFMWACVVVSTTAIYQFRLYKKNQMSAENKRWRNDQQTETDRSRDAQQAETDRLRDLYKAKNEAYKTHTEAVNKRPWFGSKPPEPPKF